MNIAVTKHSFQ